MPVDFNEVHSGDTIEQALAKEGITRKSIAKKLKGLLQAKHGKSPAHAIQLQAVDKAIRLLNLYPAEKREHSLELGPQFAAAIFGHLNAEKGKKRGE